MQNNISIIARSTPKPIRICEAPWRWPGSERQGSSSDVASKDRSKLWRNAGTRERGTSLRKPLCNFRMEPGTETKPGPANRVIGAPAKHQTVSDGVRRRLCASSGPFGLHGEVVI
ncbi:hypothetical protein EVAR_73653_1 [Eumeta japonica]|uniref:Uncharacterized protein n=1 Tax=Eumeta variegata TaxID=151549 RepID=A0A4C1SU25_EUMVA|nr:hypothetical protein EVAR_73653_1 [Eumeta japonica]